MGEGPQIISGDMPALAAPDGRAPTDPRAAIARAARATGVDFSYLLAQARLESRLDPSARAATSSAAGLYQFTSGTWLRTLDRHGAAHGLGWAGEAITGGRIDDPALRGPIMALRHDAGASALMAAELARDNRESLRGQLGREPDATELYLAHFLGAGGAGRLLSALATDPGRDAAALLPEAAAANHAIFYAAGAPRSVAGVMDLLRDKVAGAMAETGDGPHAAPVQGSGPAGEWREAASWRPPATARALQPVGIGGDSLPRASMADTLRDSFGLAGGVGASAPGFVHQAYARLRGLGL